MGAPSMSKIATPIDRVTAKLAVLQEDHVARVRQQRRDVGGEEGLAFAEAEDDRAAAVLGGDDALGIALATSPRSRTSRPSAGAGVAHRSDERRARRGAARVDQVRDQLGVGLRLDLAALGLELLPERAVVLDDAVVHHGDACRRDAGARSAPTACRASPSACGRCRRCRRSGSSREQLLERSRACRPRAASSSAPLSKTATPAES